MEPASSPLDVCLRLDGDALVLQARDPARNVARRWGVALRRDLFGWFIVEWRWGRIGTAGQMRSLAFEQEVEARRLIRRLLARRAGAKRRIGVAYRPVALANL